MHTEKVDAQDSLGATALLGGSVSEQLSVTGRYDVKCLDADGNLKWEDSIENLVVTVGKNDLLDKYFAGSTYTAAWYMGLVDSASFSAYAAGDTLASHTGWLEYLNYTISGSSTNRATAAWNAASAGSKASTATTFTISGAGGTVLGAILCTTQARNTSSNGGAGILYSAGSFATSRAVIAGDLLLVTYTASV
jgi:hypothetical protein